jgi:hypothetical protein
MKQRKRNLKECEELISSLRKKLWERDNVLSEMRMALYRAEKAVAFVEEELDGMWAHHLDGSDLLVSKEELFDVIQNRIISGAIKPAREKIKKPLLRLKEFIGW